MNTKKEKEKEIEVARINARQAIIVAVISALSGIIITLFSTGQLNEAFLTRRSIKHKVDIENLILLDESFVTRDSQNKLILKKIQKKPNYDYKNSNLVIAFALVVAGFQKNKSGNCDIAGDLYLTHPNRQIADYGELPRTVTPGEWKGRPISQNLNMNDITDVIGKTDDKMAFIQILVGFDKCVVDTNITGTAKFRVVIKDNFSKSWDEENIELRIMR